jgi:P-type Ca2+ transporter type 2C
MPESLSPQPIGIWHQESAEQVLQSLDTTSQNGLSSATVAERLRVYGPNELLETGGRSSWEILIDQFKNLMLLMLIGVAVVSGLLDWQQQQFPKDAIAILAIVILNAILGYVQESRAEQALAALKQMAAPIVRVRRDGQVAEIASATLVPGDILLLEAGDQVPADARLVETANLQVKEATLTGEAEGVEKLANRVLPENTILGDRTNCLFQGTEVLQGRGTAVVYATGMNTELGRIASLLQSVKPEPTPLQQRLEQLGRVLVVGSLVLVALVVAIGTWLGEPPAELLEVGLSMAVAIVPEGLPAVITVALAIGTQRMVRRQALIRKLPAVETLGSVTVICSDKTGTLTQNKMVVREICTADHTFKVSGEGYAPAGTFSVAGQTVIPDDYRDLTLLLTAGVVCNDAILKQDGEQWTILGDPTEGSLLTVGGKAGIEQEAAHRVLRRVDEIPFSSERKCMSVMVDDRAETTLPLRVGHPYLMVSKGSPELLLERCASVHRQGGAIALSDGERQTILQCANEIASRGMRVLGFAYRPFDQPDVSEADEHDLIWLGLMGQIDAPRPEVKLAVERCTIAGIRPVMITGDHPLTARAIAAELGIAPPGSLVITGKELATLTSLELDRAARDCNLFARVAPEDKLRIVESLQKQAQIVAMTGDGVNDAPALKQADIGVAMGITGTDVSKEASDMVLLDDNFATIVSAVEEGRVVYDNIRRFIKYILGSNIGELLVLASSPLVVGAAGVPLTPLQILWMNLVTDGLPALALAVEPGDPTVMEQSPHNSQESIFARGLGLYMLRVGLVFAVIVIAMMVISYRYTAEIIPAGLSANRWKTMIFTTLCLAQMGHAIAIRSSKLTIQQPFFTNPWLIGAVLLTCFAQFSLIYAEPLQRFFGTYSLSLEDLGICLGFSALLFVWLEGEKLVSLLRQRTHWR